MHAQGDGRVQEVGKGRRHTSTPLSTKAACGLFAAVVIAIIAFDQVTKALVRANFAHAGDSVVVIPGLFDFQLVHNMGAAFGVLSGHQAYFIAMAAVISCLIIAYLVMSHHHSAFETVTLALIVSGAIGNVIDRIARGYVTDFIATTFIDFPVFNVADCAITVGCVLFVLAFVLGNRPAAGEMVDRPTGATGTRRPHDATHGDTGDTR